MTDENGEPIWCNCGKKCYTEREAGVVLNKISSRGNPAKKVVKGKFYLRKHANVPKRKYFCRECGFWHLTHLKQFDKKRKY